jgi:hypothetical protein
VARHRVNHLRDQLHEACLHPTAILSGPRRRLHRHLGPRYCGVSATELTAIQLTAIQLTATKSSVGEIRRRVVVSKIVKVGKLTTRYTIVEALFPNLLYDVNKK